MKLHDLIAELERAKHGSRELDKMIALAMGWTIRTYEYDPVYTGRITTWWNEPGCENDLVAPLFYTTSLDDALTLVPEGAYWSIDKLGFAECASGPEERMGVSVSEYKASPAIALCIAALLAREAKVEI